MKLSIDYIFTFNLDGLISFYVQPDFNNSIKNINVNITNLYDHSWKNIEKYKNMINL